MSNHSTWDKSSSRRVSNRPPPGRTPSRRRRVARRGRAGKAPRCGKRAYALRGGRGLCPGFGPPRAARSANDLGAQMPDAPPQRSGGAVSRPGRFFQPRGARGAERVLPAFACCKRYLGALSCPGCAAVGCARNRQERLCQGTGTPDGPAGAAAGRGRPDGLAGGAGRTVLTQQVTRSPLHD